MEELTSSYIEQFPFINSYDTDSPEVSYPALLLDRTNKLVYVYGLNIDITYEMFDFIIEVIEKIQKDKFLFIQNTDISINSKKYSKNNFSQKIRFFNNKVKNAILSLNNNEDSCYHIKKVISNIKGKGYTFCKKVDVVIK